MRKINYGDGRYICPWGFRKANKTPVIVGSQNCHQCTHCIGFYDKTIECKYDETIKR